MVDFFTADEERQIIERIREAESRSSGEIRVHLASSLQGDILQAAQEVFYRLNMHRTEARNGVLFYLVPDKHKFAIIGDEGIDQLVPDDFWDEAARLAEHHFRRGEFADGVCAVIDEIGRRLAEYFPHAGEADVNELPDQLSFD